MKMKLKSFKKKVRMKILLSLIRLDEVYTCHVQKKNYKHIYNHLHRHTHMCERMMVKSFNLFPDKFV